MVAQLVWGSYMKKILLASTFLFAVAGSVHAADAVIYEPTPEIAPAGLIWTGGYVGLQFGGGWSKVDQPYGYFRSDPAAFSQDNANGSGVLGGVHAGYNWQSGSFVFGGEADVDATSIDGDDGKSGGETNGFKAQWMASVRARAGYAFDRWLIYGTGGYAYLHGKADVRDPARQQSHSASFNGWTIGAGAEYALTNNITVRGEYRFADFGTKTVAFDSYFEDISPQIQAVRIGLSYKF